MSWLFGRKKSNAEKPKLEASAEVAKVFGKNLTDDYSYPKFVMDCFAYLSHPDRVVEEGILRISGDNVKVNQLQMILDKGEVETINFENETDVHTAASLLKLYFRMMPDPLLSYEQYDMFIAAQSIPDDEARLQCIKKIIDFLPAARVEMIRVLCTFLNQVATYSSVNKMSAANIAIVFAPNLIKSRDEALEFEMEHIKQRNDIMTTLIKECKYIFVETHQDNTESTSQPSTEEQMKLLPDDIRHSKTIAEAKVNINRFTIRLSEAIGTFLIDEKDLNTIHEYYRNESPAKA